MDPSYNSDNLFLTVFLHLILFKNTALKCFLILITELLGTLFCSESILSRLFLVTACPPSKTAEEQKAGVTSQEGRPF